MKLVPTKALVYFFINYNVFTFKVHPLSLHTHFPAVLSLFVAFLEHSLWDVVQGLGYRTLDVSVDTKWCPFTANFTF